MNIWRWKNWQCYFFFQREKNERTINSYGGSNCNLTTHLGIPMPHPSPPSLGHRRQPSLYIRESLLPHTSLFCIVLSFAAISLIGSVPSPPASSPFSNRDFLGESNAGFTLFFLSFHWSEILPIYLNIPHLDFIFILFLPQWLFLCVFYR